ncbi:hypothetical protein VTK26DRAFT_518 [Humicola hyalothermophila]
MSSSVFSTPAKSTPVKQVGTAGSAVNESPGNWKHPRLAEITRRQNKTIFSEKNLRQIVYNAGALVGIGAVRQIVLPYVPAQLFPRELRQHSTWIYAALIIIPLINIALALLPLVRPKDDLSDIPLTPAQRKLLGLPPSSKPATPNSVYSTPPRYSRTPSLAGSPASIKSYASSPLSNLASPGSGPYTSKLTGTSPAKHYSPSAVSPLLQKAVGGGAVATGGNPPRTTFGSPSPLGASTSSSIFGASTASSLFGGDSPTTPSTPTPAATGKRSSVGLNNKWLYEKGRRNSSNSWLHQAL